MGYNTTAIWTEVKESISSGGILRGYYYNRTVRSCSRVSFCGENATHQRKQTEQLKMSVTDLTREGMCHKQKSVKKFLLQKQKIRNYINTQFYISLPYCNTIKDRYQAKQQ